MEAFLTAQVVKDHPTVTTKKENQLQLSPGVECLFCLHERLHQVSLTQWYSISKETQKQQSLPQSASCLQRTQVGQVQLI